jgi:hypothetical protein
MGYDDGRKRSVAAAKAAMFGGAHSFGSSVLPRWVRRQSHVCRAAILHNDARTERFFAHSTSRTMELVDPICSIALEFGLQRSTDRKSGKVSGSRRPVSLVNHDAEASRSRLSNPDQLICWLARWCLAPGSVRLSQKSHKVAVLIRITLFSALSLPDRRERGSRRPAVPMAVGALLGWFKVPLRPGVADAATTRACKRRARTLLLEKTKRRKMEAMP